eukprot:11177039-Lingulodinium_polyedra.AAC.1
MTRLAAPHAEPFTVVMPARHAGGSLPAPQLRGGPRAVGARRLALGLAPDQPAEGGLGFGCEAPPGGGLVAHAAAVNSS